MTASTSAPAPKTPLRVLLVEDDAENVVLTRKRLAGTRGSWEIEHVESLGEALERLSRRDVDVVLLDLHLPDARGLETVTRLCGAYPDLPVVVLTSHQDEAMGVVAVQKGAQDYLVKTQVDKSGLDRSLRYAIERMRAAEARARWMALAEATDDAIVTTSLAGSISSCSPGAARLYGYAVEDLIGRPLSVLAPEAQAAASRELLARVLSGERVAWTEAEHRRKDGSPLRVTVAMAPIRGTGGRVLGATVVARERGSRPVTA